MRSAAAPTGLLVNAEAQDTLAGSDDEQLAVVPAVIALAECGATASSRVFVFLQVKQTMIGDRSHLADHATRGGHDAWGRGRAGRRDQVGRR